MNSEAYLKELSLNGVKDYHQLLETKDIPRYEIEPSKQIRIANIKDRCKDSYIPVHRHTYYEIIVITKVTTQLHSHEIDFIEYSFTEGNIYFIYPNQTHKWNIDNFNGEVEGYILNFNESFLLEKSNTIKQILSKLFTPYEPYPYLNYKKHEFKSFFSILDIFEKEYNKKQHNKNILRALLETLLYCIHEIKAESSEVVDSNFQKLNILRTLIEENYKDEKNSDFYSRKMELSSKRLNEIVKKASGYTITQLIHNRLILEAKREMVSQAKTIQTISCELGFENPSYFTRFFKKHELLTPKEYSKQMFK